MIANHGKMEIILKIVYFGPAMSGKTTSLKNLFKQHNKEDSVQSIETTSGRTLYFDFGALSMKGGKWTIKFHLYTATGQDFYAATRPATLAGADGIIFVVDAQRQFIDLTKESWDELKLYYGEKIKTLPVIVCRNKSDLADIATCEEISDLLDLDALEKTGIISTIATTGDGILASFRQVVKYIFPAVKI